MIYLLPIDKMIDIYSPIDGDLGFSQFVTIINSTINDIPMGVPFYL